MAKPRQQVKTAILTTTDTATFTAGDRMGSDSIVDLHTNLEALRAEDGGQVKVLSIRTTYTCYGDAAGDSFAILPIVVQTAGTWTDNVDVNTRRVSEVLADAIDDVFGYQSLAPNCAAGRYLASGVFVARISTPVPQNILQILNRELESEKLQSLYTGLVIASHDVTVVTIKAVTEIKYIETRKQIIMR